MAWLSLPINELSEISESSNNSSYISINSDESLRRKLRKCKIENRRNNATNLEHELKKIPNPVVQQIEKNEFELGVLIEKAYNFMESRGLIFAKPLQNENEHESLDYKNYQMLLFENKNKLDKIKQKWLEIDYNWDEISKKEDIMVKYDDIAILRDRSLKVIKEKENICDKLVEELEKFLIECMDETLVNSNDLVKLNTICKSKIQFVKEEHEKYNSIISEILGDEINKISDKDYTAWTLLLDKVVIKITSASLQHSLASKQKNFDLIRQHVHNQEKMKDMRIAMAEKYVGADVDLKFIEMKCSENLEKLLYNCDILKKRITENEFSIANKKKLIIKLQDKKDIINERSKRIELDAKTHLLTTKKQIIYINSKIIEKERWLDSVIKKDKCEYKKLWDSLQNNIIKGINNILKIDYFIHKYFDISRTQLPCEKLTINLLPLQNIYNSVPNTLNENLEPNDYKFNRDKALNKLLLNFFVKNSSFVVDNNEIGITNSIQNLSYAYNALNRLKLNDEKTWNLLKFKFKPLVKCIVCNSQINWDDEIIRNSNSFLKQNNCKNISENCTKEMKSRMSMYEGLSTYLTQYNENSQKVKYLNSLELQDTINFNNDKFENEEQTDEIYSTDVVNNDTPQNYTTQCTDVNHELYIDNKYFIPIIKEIMEEIQSIKCSNNHENVKKQYDCVQKKNISEDDLRAYWSQFSTYIPSSTIDLWDILYKAIGRYYEILIASQKKLLKANTLRNENKKLKKIKKELERDLLQ